MGEAGVLSEGLKKQIQDSASPALPAGVPEPHRRNRDLQRPGQAEIEKIIDLQLQNLRRLLSERKIEITLTDKARELLFQQGYDPQFGARPLKRAIQRLIQDPLAMKLLDGEIAPGESLVVDADPKRGEMIFQPAVAKAART